MTGLKLSQFSKILKTDTLSRNFSRKMEIYTIASFLALCFFSKRGKVNGKGEKNELCWEFCCYTSGSREWSLLARKFYWEKNLDSVMCTKPQKTILLKVTKLLTTTTWKKNLVNNSILFYSVCVRLVALFWQS